ncbi:hypothetical protein I545_5319 [Mycobacterium kansasii 662]|uniref:Uncharacterized protein n=2 Tax=Mycobacterium kansasii TaxID=1768 RepID=A0A1V3WFB7_MYCKA|nr:hypothetical protein I545_5319 [Mycobacterium kansasii 662]KEP44095.1 hypothetical protein MKSMC1_08510 [Mycobacterium kansasii]OOK65674.1 hypothetical protein BZL30_8651 [Mycobacterium kansasii]
MFTPDRLPGHASALLQRHRRHCLAGMHRREPRIWPALSAAASAGGKPLLLNTAEAATRPRLQPSPKLPGPAYAATDGALNHAIDAAAPAGSRGTTHSVTADIPSDRLILRACVDSLVAQRRLYTAVLKSIHLYRT